MPPREPALTPSPRLTAIKQRGEALVSKARKIKLGEPKAAKTTPVPARKASLPPAKRRPAQGR